jgi:flagellar motor switch protein FliN/FliY
LGKRISPPEAHSVSKPLGTQPQGYPPAKLAFLSDVPVKGVVILGRATLTIKEILGLDVGSIVELDRPVGEGLDFTVNGAPFGKVEVTVIEDTYGLRVAEIINPFEG